MRVDARRLATPVMALCFLCATSALAHRVNIFATWTGERIEGECYASDGDAVKGQTVVVHGPDGAELGRVTTNAEGGFVFAPPQCVTLRFLIDTADGHHAEFTVPATDMASGGAAAPQAAAQATEAAPVAEATLPAAGDSVTGAVRKAVAPLERRIDKLETQIRFRDILGGIGYIWGVAGVVLYLRCRRPKG